MSRLIGVAWVWYNTAVANQEESIMARSKHKREKKEETAQEFVERMSAQNSPRNGLSSPLVWVKRRHGGK